MRSLHAVIALFTLAGLAAAARAVEMTWIYAVQLRATAHANPARIELSWVTDPFPVRDYVLHRKALGDAEWSPGLTLDAGATSFTDENVEAGKIYEYQVI